jgi:hypothetical protein
MIQNRNIASGAFIDPTKVAGFGCGEVFYVCNSADTPVKNWLNQRVPGSHLFVGTSTDSSTAIQKALDSCVANRNDYVIIMPSDTNYGLAAALTMSKKSVHLVCPSGLNSGSLAVGNTARLKQLTAACRIINVSAQACEIAGFYLKNYTALSHIGLAAGAHAPNIHNNAFMLVWSGAQKPAITNNILGTSGDTGCSWGSIERNWFISESGTSITAAIGAVEIVAYATGARVCHNEVTIGDGNIATIGISNQAVKGHTDFNVFSESGGDGVASGGTITKCVSVAATGCAIGNIGAVGTGQMLTGGTTLHSYAENYGGYIANVGTTNGSVEA